MKKYINIAFDFWKKYKEVLNYLFFGGLATLLNIVIYEIFKFNFGLNMANGWGNVLNNCICILFAYTTNRLFVFSSKTQGAKAIKEFFSFVSCRIGTLFVDISVMFFGATVLGNMFIPTEYLELWGTGMKILANVIVVVLNYILSKLIVFKKGNTQDK